MFGLNRNRRGGSRSRDRVLDVRLHNDAVRNIRWQRMGVVLAWSAAIVVAVVAAKPVRSLVLDRWVYATPAFALRDFVVTTDGILSRTEIEQTAGVRPGQNVLALDLPTLRDRLAAHPRIASISLERRLPGSLRIDIRERTPVARISVLQLSDVCVTYLLDEADRKSTRLNSSH